MNMAHRLKLWIAKRRKDEQGFSLVDVVVSIALFSAIGFVFVYATITLEGARKQSMEETSSTISQTGVTNAFREDIADAKAVKVNAVGDALSVARADGSCVVWEVKAVPGGVDSTLHRSTAVSSAPVIRAYPLSKGVATGKFTLEGNSVGIKIDFNSGKGFNEKATLNLAGSNGGACW